MVPPSLEKLGDETKMLSSLVTRGGGDTQKVKKYNDEINTKALSSPHPFHEYFSKGI